MGREMTPTLMQAKAEHCSPVILWYSDSGQRWTIRAEAPSLSWRKTVTLARSRVAFSVDYYHFFFSILTVRLWLDFCNIVYIWISIPVITGGNYIMWLHYQGTCQSCMARQGPRVTFTNNWYCFICLQISARPLGYPMSLLAYRKARETRHAGR